MAAWDAEPDFNPETGLPYGFIEMPLETHVGLWTRAPGLALTQSRYVALLLSMHGTALYEMRDLEKARRPRTPARVRAYMAASASSRRSFARRSARPEEEVARNQRLLWNWDYLSLALLLGWLPATAKRVPTTGEPVDLVLSEDLVLDPWPFAAPFVDLSCDGRVLDGPYADEAEMRRALREAPWVQLDFRLLHSTAP